MGLMQSYTSKKPQQAPECTEAEEEGQPDGHTTTWDENSALIPVFLQQKHF